MKKQTLKSESERLKKKKNIADRPQTKVKSGTGSHSEKDTNPLPPNPNEVDNHESN